MGVPVLVARIFGPCFFIVGISMLLNRNFFQRVMEDFCKNAALMFFMGMPPLVFGILLVLYCNAWAANWRVLVTIIAWLSIIKGVWLIVFPDSTVKLMRAYRRNETLLVVHSVVALVFGAVLTIFGYFVG